MSAQCTTLASRAATIIAIVSSVAFTTGRTTAFGPPHIAVRTVAATDAAPAGAVLLVEGTHHHDTAVLTVVGRAEGMVDGKRVSLPLRIARQSTTQFSVTRQWQDGTPWVLVLSAELGANGAHAVAEALVPVAARGTIGTIGYPAPGWIERSNTPRRTAPAAIDAMLARLVAQR